MTFPAPSYLPPPPLTVRPVGLLDFLGIQSGGKHPQSLARELLPVLALTDWYRESQVEVIQGTAANCSSIASFVGLVTVPAGECWLVQSVDLFSTAAIPAGVTSFNACLGESVVTAVCRNVLNDPRPANLVGSTGTLFRSVWTPPLQALILPGVTLGVQCVQYSGAGSVNMNVNVRAARLSV